MRMGMWLKALRRVSAFGLLGALLAGCGGYAGGGYPGYYGRPGYYGAPYAPYGYGAYGPRGYYPRGGYYAAPSPRRENWSQDRLRQHWIDSARQAR